MQPANHVLDFEAFKTRYQQVPVEEYPNRVLEAVPEPVVSVQISTYQHANFIHDCLDGVLMQETDFPIEILIGEDESTDGTREICKAYAERHPDKIRLFLHCRENNIHIQGNPTGRFQTTYTRFMCRGTYVAFCEGDDYWTDPLKLQKQVDGLECTPEAVVACHGASVIDAEGNQLKERKLPSELQRDHTAQELREGAFLLTLSLCFQNVIDTYPVEYFSVLNGDTFLISLLGHHGSAIFTEDVRPAAYRLHERGIWGGISGLQKAVAQFNTYTELNKCYLRTKYKREARVHFIKSVNLGLQLCSHYAQNDDAGRAAEYFTGIIVSCIVNDEHKLVNELVNGSLNHIAQRLSSSQ